MRFTTAEIAESARGTEVGPPAIVNGASQDSRRIRPGMLFVPLVADRDGHDFIDAALDAGASAYLTALEPSGGSAVRVDDTNAALADLGSTARDRIEGHVVGITGSVGKTSTKDLLAAALATTMSTHASEKSFNNEIGVPLTILDAPDDVEALVVEMGSRGVGHIESLCRIARPTVGIVTTVAAAHTGEFGSFDRIALAKGELVEALPADGLAVLNGDVDLVGAMATRTEAAVLTFGESPGVNVRYSEVELDDELRVRFVIESDWGRFEVRPATRGSHLVPNATAAAASALWMGVEPEAVAAGMAEAVLSPWRMELHRIDGGAVVINDSYNANPTSMKGALDSLVALPAERRIAILGYMGELGDDERADHVDVADYARARDIEVVAVGTDLYGIEPADDPVKAVGRLADGDAVLVKASRSAGLERIADALVRATDSVVDVEG